MSEYYDRELDILDQAYTTKGGIRLVFKSVEARKAYRMKLYRRRLTDRMETARAYDKPVRMGLSPYDALIFFQLTEPDGRPSLLIKQPESDIELLDKDSNPIEIKRE